MPPVLLLIDLQNDYFPGGAKALPGATAALDRATALLAAFRQCQLPVVHVRHEARRPGATFFLPGSPGAQIHPALAPRADEPVVTKQFPSAFRETALAERLRAAGAAPLVIAGMMTQMCIDTSVRAAADLGFDCRLAHDACAASPLAFGGEEIAAETVHAAFVAALDGTFARARRVDELVTELVGAP